MQEIEAIRSTGLQPASPKLAEAKVAAAVDALGSQVSDADADLLRRCGPLTWQGKSGRAGLVWVAAPMSIFETSGFVRLLGDWGGELVGWVDSQEASAVIERLKAHSTPSIVDVAVGAGDLGRRAQRLWTTAVGIVLSLDEAHNEWAIDGAIRSDRVLNVRHPDDPTWPVRYAYLRQV